MLAQYLVWDLHRALAPLTYIDEHPPVRDNPVAPATRSAHAERKAARHTTTECRPVRSFHSLPEHLATLTRNTITVGDRTFDKISTPTTEQQRAFDLLGARSRSRSGRQDIHPGRRETPAQPRNHPLKITKLRSSQSRIAAAREAHCRSVVASLDAP
jgi:hypothetical protein